MASIFTKIINGELPSYKVFEDDKVIAILAIDQVNLGHTLVIPKIEVDHFFQTPEPHYSAVFSAAKIISPAIQKSTDCKRVLSAIVGFEVPHFHLHLIPAMSMADLNFSKAKRHSDEEMKRIALAISSSIKEN